MGTTGGTLLRPNWMTHYQVSWYSVCLIGFFSATYYKDKILFSGFLEEIMQVTQMVHVV